MPIRRPLRPLLRSSPTSAAWQSGAEQTLAYVQAGAAALGALPSTRMVVAERFFDEGGGMQLVLHAPFGARFNRA